MKRGLIVSKIHNNETFAISINKRSLAICFICSILVIDIALYMPSLKVYAQIPSQSQYNSGYSIGCSDAKIPYLDRYITQPNRGPGNQTAEFLSGYGKGFESCSSQHNNHNHHTATPQYTPTNTATPQYVPTHHHHHHQEAPPYAYDHYREGPPPYAYDHY